MGGVDPWKMGTPMRVLDAKQEDEEMTIYRRGGGEEKINTATGKIPIADFTRRATLPVPPPGEKRPIRPAPPGGDLLPIPPDPPPDAGEVLNLTDEVVSQPGGLEAIPVPSAVPERVPQVVRGAPLGTRPLPSSPAPYPLPPIGMPPPFLAPPVPGPGPYNSPVSASAAWVPPPIELTLGALVDAGGNTVDAESFHRLERRFWALMRVLAKKGVLTNEDFLKELADEY
jgi:hypothetical protein